MENENAKEMMEPFRKEQVTNFQCWIGNAYISIRSFSPEYQFSGTELPPGPPTQQKL